MPVRAPCTLVLEARLEQRPRSVHPLAAVQVVVCIMEFSISGEAITNSQSLEVCAADIVVERHEVEHSARFHGGDDGHVGRYRLEICICHKMGHT